MGFQAGFTDDAVLAAAPQAASVYGLLDGQFASTAKIVISVSLHDEIRCVTVSMYIAP